jgi:arylsulfatase A-like enzyme
MKQVSLFSMRLCLVGFITVLMVGLLAGYAPRQQAPARPNIIYIYADDLGYGELGCYGQQKIRTPNLDQIAWEGMRFTQHYSSAPVCAPARCMLLTGKHAGHSYIRGNYELGGFADSLEGGQMPLYPNAFTIGKMLQQSGYKTACIGKWGTIPATRTNRASITSTVTSIRNRRIITTRLTSGKTGNRCG